MTREEMLDGLYEIKNWKCDGDEKMHEVVTEAIKALEQDSCEDEYIRVPKKALKYRTAGMVAYNAEWLKNHFDIERAVICGVQEPILDKIRAEIEHEYKCLSNTRADETLELGECLGLKMSLKIIDKHIGGGNQNELLHRL